MIPAIRASDLGKCYRIQRHAGGGGYRTLREGLVDLARWPLGRLRGEGEARSESFWALRDVDFEVRPGEVVGIVGRNGAGKSTLLKILSRITRPTTGRVELHGRVGSLLEVGAGFHPELTGRENIFLNGTILGMTRHEIGRKFDAIVEFAEVSKFLDTPVKRYSSGMYVRLAFAVAAHLESDILIVDEVLAVGDVNFQRKCLGKMGDVARSGRTILFVSHNLGAITELCTRCILLAGGQVARQGRPLDVVRGFLESGAGQSEVDLVGWTAERTGSGPLALTRLATLDRHGRPASTFGYREPITFEVDLSGRPGSTYILGIILRNANGSIIAHLNSAETADGLELDSPSVRVRATLEENLLNDGDYYVTLWLADALDNLNDRAGNCLSFTVDGATSGPVRNIGCVRLGTRWQSTSAVPCGA